MESFNNNDLLMDFIDDSISNEITDVFIPSSLLIRSIFLDYNRCKTLLSDTEFSVLKYSKCEFDCCICFECRKMGITLDCDHQFCKKCIKKWLTERSSKCPVCRKNVKK
jgi:hypothetical protein